MKFLMGLLPILLMGCSSSVIERTETIPMEITDIDPPRRFHVTFSDRDGSMTTYIGKRCRTWEQNTRIGMIVPVQVVYRRYEDGSLVREINDGTLKGRFCK